MGLAERLRDLAALVPILESPNADFGRWEVPPPVGGVHSLGYFVFGPTAAEYLQAVARGGWINAGFDWRSWMEGEGRTLRDDPDTRAGPGDETS